AAEADEIDLRLAAEVEDAPAELVARGTSGALDDGGADAGFAGALEAVGVVAVADDQRHLGPQPAVGGAVEEVLPRGAGAAGQHRQTDRGHVIIPVMFSRRPRGGARRAAPRAAAKRG